MQTSTSASDASYHRRHARRTYRRAQCIAANIAGPVSVLDVGCNIGLTSEYLLNCGVARKVTGLELLADTVADKLKRDPRFTLIEGDVVSTPLEQSYDVVIYGAVHHHVLAHHGLSVAVASLQKLAACTNRTLFFETGHLSEGGRWYWQPTLRRYFSTDEDHIHYLLSSIEHAIEDFKVVGQFLIHGIRRPYLRIDLKPRENRRPDPVAAASINAVAEQPAMGRTFGLPVQQLALSTAPECRDSPTRFAAAQSSSGQKLFLKRHLHRPNVAAREAAIGLQTTRRWAVTCIGTLDDGETLVFPYLDGGRTVDQLATEPRTARIRVADQLLRIFREAEDTLIELSQRPLLSYTGKKTLLDLCDFSIYNVVVIQESGSLAVRVVDFEQQSINYRWRNYLHLRRMLLALGCRRFQATAAGARGIVTLFGQLLRNQLLPMEQRIRHRRVSLASVAVTRIRNLSGDILRYILNTVGQR